MNTALIIVDMQLYYLSPACDFYSYHQHLHPGSMDYISHRCTTTVIPNIRRLISVYTENRSPVLYLCLCGTREDRGDLHRFFKTAHRRARENGYSNLYPLEKDPDAAIVPELAPGTEHIVIPKTNFSPFCNTSINEHLTAHEVQTLVFTGLATSQCVETSARDASDRGYSVINIEDAQADYSEESHYASLFSSQPVCGGWVYDTDHFLSHYNSIMHSIETQEEIGS